jgi:thymidylate synthase
MSFNYWSESLQDIHKVLMMTLHDDFDYESAPRGKPIKELVAASFTLENPRNRLIESPARKVNYGFAVGELCWYLRGDYDLETMLYYNKRMVQFSDDGERINSAYGHRLFKNRWHYDSPKDDRSQWDNIVDELKRDPDSRRAVMHINEPRDLWWAVDRGSKDVPCTMSLQLLIRDRKLHMHVLMRSNDVVWGLPYDVFSFTCLQESFLYKLQAAGVPVDDLGTYNHTAGSLHVYDTHFTMAEEVSKEPDLDLPPMKPFTLDGMERIAEVVEPDIRTGKGDHVWVHPGETESWMLDRLIEHRDKRITEAQRRDEALTQLTRLTEEMGGYSELEEKK